MYKYGWRATISRRRNKRGHWEDQMINTLADLGYVVSKVSFPAIPGQKRMTCKKMAQHYPKGTFIMRVAHHVSCLKNGTIYDTGNPENKCIYFAWKITKIK